MTSSSSWATAVLDALHRYQQRDFLCDYTLAGNDGIAFGVHSCVLAAASPLLYRHLNKTVDSVKSLACSAYGVQALVNYAYTGVLDVQNCGKDDACKVNSLLGSPSPTSEEDAPDVDSTCDGFPLDTVPVYNERTGTESPTEDDQCKEVLVRSIKCEVQEQQEDNASCKSSGLHHVHEETIANISAEVNSGNGLLAGGDFKTEHDAVAGYNISIAELGDAMSTGPADSDHALGHVSNDESYDHDVEEPKGEQDGLPEPQDDNHSVASKPLVCNLCNTRFATKNDLLTHETVCEVCTDVKIREKKDRLSFDCPRCGHYMPSLLALKKHTGNAHGNVLPLSCEICNRGFLLERHLQRHYQMHTSRQPFKCKHCSQAFKWQASYNWHVAKCPAAARSAGKPRKYPCYVCRTLYASEKAASEHMKSHAATCDVCGKTLTTSASLTAHKRFVHEGIKEFSCEICGKAFPKRKTLVAHSVVHTGEKPFHCDKCGKDFSSKDYFRKHEKICPKASGGLSMYACHTCLTRFPTLEARGEHLKSHAVTCDVCGKMISSPKNLALHKRNVHSDSGIQFCCEICGKAFANKMYVDMHVRRVHSREMTQVCTVCGKGFHSRRDLKSHMYAHANKPFTCGSCEKTFPSKKSLERHESLHRPKYPRARAFPCGSCKQSFVSKTSLENHEIRHRSKRQFPCGSCDKSYRSKKSLRLHETRHLKGGTKTFCCEVCGKAFHEKSKLNVHIRRMHDKEVSHLCTVCGKGFFHSRELKRHVLQTHTEKTFPCGSCDKSFPSKEILKQHEMRHRVVAERVFECSYCGKAFQAQRDLVVHERIRHTKELPFKCGECDKAYATATLLRTHKRAHTGERPYLCTMCPATYPYGGTLRVHYRTKHGVDVHIRLPNSNRN